MLEGGSSSPPLVKNQKEPDPHDILSVYSLKFSSFKIHIHKLKKKFKTYLIGSLFSSHEIDENCTLTQEWYFWLKGSKYLWEGDTLHLRGDGEVQSLTRKDMYSDAWLCNSSTAHCFSQGEVRRWGPHKSHSSVRCGWPRLWASVGLYNLSCGPDFNMGGGRGM